METNESKNIDTSKKEKKELNQEEQNNKEHEAEENDQENPEVEISGEQEEIENIKTQLEEKNEEIINLNNELKEANDKFLRKAAEFENLKKRTAKERIQFYGNAKVEALRDFLPINDDLKRTLKAAEEVEVENTFLEGVKMVANKFDEVLKKYGVEAIDEVDVPFNVDFHDAMMKQKAPSDEVESNMVLQVLEPGYKMKDRVIRHAKVIVSE
ncbi:MAG TPA: nucleotide exchange factor GrpE [Balneolales bacterium]|nr:nucleotide exchange factor GrpE [Balneolales bacterium]